MEMKCYTGTCDNKQLSMICKGIMGFGMVSKDNLPDDVIVLPCSKRRQTRHLAFKATGSVIVPNEVRRINGTRIGIYFHELVAKVRWISRRRNELLAKRLDENLFEITITKRTMDYCHFRDIAERNQVKLALQR